MSAPGKCYTKTPLGGRQGFSPGPMVLMYVGDYEPPSAKYSAKAIKTAVPKSR